MKNIYWQYEKLTFNDRNTQSNTQIEYCASIQNIYKVHKTHGTYTASVFTYYLFDTTKETKWTAIEVKQCQEYPDLDEHLEWT